MPEGIGYKIPVRQYPNKGGTKAALPPLTEPSPATYKNMKGHARYSEQKLVKQYPGKGGKR